jgi:hypothetical protein
LVGRKPRFYKRLPEKPLNFPRSPDRKPKFKNQISKSRYENLVLDFFVTHASPRLLRLINVTRNRLDRPAVKLSFEKVSRGEKPQDRSLQFDEKRKLFVPSELDRYIAIFRPDEELTTTEVLIRLGKAPKAAKPKPSPKPREAADEIDFAQMQVVGMAERGGFEPPVPLLGVHTISSRAPSTARSPLR